MTSIVHLLSLKFLVRAVLAQKAVVFARRVVLGARAVRASGRVRLTLINRILCSKYGVALKRVTLQKQVDVNGDGYQRLYDGEAYLLLESVGGGKLNVDAIRCFLENVVRHNTKVAVGSLYLNFVDGRTFCHGQHRAPSPESRSWSSLDIHD